MSSGADKIREFLNQQKKRGVGGGGTRTPFWKKLPGPNVGRLFQYTDKDGDSLPCYRYFSHRLSMKDQAVCPKMFDKEAECEHCDKVRMLYDSDQNTLAGQLIAKSQYWYLFVPLMPGFQPVFHVLDMPYGLNGDTMLGLAFKGGWQNPRANLEDEEFINAYLAGVQKCFGPGGHDFKFEYHPKQGKNSYPVVDFSSRPGKKLVMETVPLDLESVFRIVKRLDKGRQQQRGEPSAPPPDFETMSKTSLISYAETKGVKIDKKLSKAKIIEAIKEE